MGKLGQISALDALQEAFIYNIKRRFDMQAIALIVVSAAGLWLVGVAFLMALRPRYCLQLFEKMSANLERSNWRLQFTEQGLRVLAGVALIVRAPASKLPLVFEVAGWLLVATSLLIMVAPIWGKLTAKIEAVESRLES